jgi:penicillin V acylase-like amidase (Ntn superfamily)
VVLLDVNRAALSALDLAAYILATYSNVSEVREALDPAKFAVVTFWLSPAAMQVPLCQSHNN